MAKTKAELIKEAKQHGLDVTEKNTVKEIEQALSSAHKDDNQPSPDEKAGDSQPKPLAKAGKRSAKAVKESEEREAKEKRKAEQSDSDQENKPKAHKPARSKLERRGKRYKDNAKLIDKSKEYSLKEALDLAKKSSSTKFDATVELHARLNVDPKQSDQNIRGSIVMPEGSGKSVNVAVVADDEQSKAAQKAGAKIVGEDNIFSKLDKNEVDFDVLIATPDMMQKLSKYARLLGPKGLMPNPKSGTVTKEVDKAVKEAIAGKVDYRVDSYGIVHAPIGKVSFAASALENNANAILESIKSQKPSSVKGALINTVYVTSSMGPSIRLATNEL